MVEILTATAEIRSLVFALVSTAQNTDGYDPEEINFTLALLHQQVNARCEAIDAQCQPASEKASSRRRSVVPDLPSAPITAV